jgi:hypothetical protein
VTWKVANVSTSADLADTSWPDFRTGYALDVRGGLFRTQNSGLTWQTLSAGPGGAAQAVVALPDGTVLLFEPKGIKKAVGGGEFNPIVARAVTRATLTDAQVAGTAVFTWGAKALLASTDKGTTGKAIKPPTKKTRVRQAAFVSRSAGFLLDRAGRVVLGDVQRPERRGVRGPVGRRQRPHRRANRAAGGEGDEVRSHATRAVSGASGGATSATSRNSRT